MRFLWRRSPRRTLVLGIAALGVLLWGAVSQFDLPREQVLASLLASVISLLLIIALAALAVALWMGIRRLIADREERKAGSSADDQG